jgi:RHS repeat-associated protein
LHPFGEEISTAERTAALGYQPDTVRQKFTGYERDDETDLDYAKARMYSTILGRFTGVDPLRANVPLADPQMFNRFSYVRGSPTKFVDPLGLVRDDPGWVIDGGQCAKRNGRCIKGGLSPLTADLEGPIGTDYSATILVPNALISQLDRDAEIFYSLALSVGKKLLFALEQVSATRTMINRNHNNVFNSLFGINSGDVLQYSRLNDGTYLAGPDVTFQLGIEASPVGSSMSITYSIKGVFDEYNVARRELNEQYNIAKAAFVAAWSDVVVPVERSDLGYRTANLTRDYLESLYEKRVRTAFSRGELKGLSESSGPPLPGGF